MHLSRPLRAAGRRERRLSDGLRQGAEGRALLAFAGFAVITGGNPVGVRFSNRELAPLWGAGLRFLVAAAVLFAVVAVLRLELPRARARIGALVYGGLGFGASFAFGYHGLVHVHAGLTQTIFALVPLATLLLAALQGEERLRLAGVVGVVLALAGIASLSSAPLREGVPLGSLLSLLASVVCIAQATVAVRRFPPVHPVTMNAVAMATGAALLLAASVVSGEPAALPHSTGTWLGFGYVVLFGSVIGFVLYIVLLEHWPASRASYAFVVAPFFSVVLSAWLDNEPLRPELLLGGALVLAGVYVGALRPGREPVTPPA